MTYFKHVYTQMADSPSIDAFGRSRTSDPFTLFASAHDAALNDDFWHVTTTGSGSATHVPAEAAVRLRTTTASGDKVVRQTFKYWRYLPGKSQMILLTGIIGAAATNVRKRWGYFDANNGLFFEQTSTAVSVVRRTNTSGSPVDTAVTQANWNLDKMNGSGPSGITLDLSKSMIFFIDFEWLGVGRVRFGLVIDGKVYYVHELLNTNNLSIVYMRTPNLPIRYEIENTGTASSATNDLMQVCSTVVSEGGSTSEVVSRVRSVSNGITTISVTTRRAVLSIRPAATLSGLTNRALIELLDVQYNNNGNQPVLIELVRGGTLGGSPSWGAAATGSAVEFDVAGTTVTGGTTVWSGYAPAANNGGKVNVPFGELVNSDLGLFLDPAGANPIVLSVVATSFGAATAGSAALTWSEVY